VLYVSFKLPDKVVSGEPDNLNTSEDIHTHCSAFVAAVWVAEGPMVIMAGTHNFNYISLKSGFGSRISAWPENEILFFFNTANPF
jgi:hypothetical protein